MRKALTRRQVRFHRAEIVLQWRAYAGGGARKRRGLHTAGRNKARHRRDFLVRVLLLKLAGGKEAAFSFRLVDAIYLAGHLHNRRLHGVFMRAREG